MSIIINMRISINMSISALESALNSELNSSDFAYAYAHFALLVAQKDTARLRRNEVLCLVARKGVFIFGHHTRPCARPSGLVHSKRV